MKIRGFLAPQALVFTWLAADFFASVQDARAAPASPRELPPGSDALAHVRLCHEVNYRHSSYARLGNLLCVYGPIVQTRNAALSPDAADKNASLATSIARGEIDWIVVRSGGGAFAVALPFGEAILGKNVTLVVDGICASACANYFFLPAAHKIVLRNSLVFWHGAPSRENGVAAMPVRDGEKSDRLMRRAGVKLGLLIDPKLPPTVKPDFQKIGWTYSPETLERCFGVKGIVSMWYEPEKLSSFFPHLAVLHPKSACGE